MHHSTRYYLLSDFRTNHIVFKPAVETRGKTNDVSSFQVRQISTFPHPILGETYPHAQLAANVIKGSYYVKRSQDVNWLTKGDLTMLRSSHVILCSVKAGWGRAFQFVVPVSISEVPV